MDKEKTFKTTIAHFAYFKKECEVWIERYGLKDWRVYFEHAEIADRPCACACTEVDLENRLVRITLNTVWVDIKPAYTLLYETAYHEVCHVLLHRLTEMAMSREVFRDAIENEVHVIIRRLESCLE